jgi:hypothetical protein
MFYLLGLQEQFFPGHGLGEFNVQSLGRIACLWRFRLVCHGSTIVRASPSPSSTTLKVFVRCILFAIQKYYFSRALGPAESVQQREKMV